MMGFFGFSGFVTAALFLAFVPKIVGLFSSAGRVDEAWSEYNSAMNECKRQGMSQYESRMACEHLRREYETRYDVMSGL